jgi:outer membrane protein insertion porin family
VKDPNVLQRATNTLIASAPAAALAACLVVATIAPSAARAQGMGSGMPAIPQSMFGPKKQPREAAGPSLSATDEPVADIRIVGNRTIPTTQILDELQTRVGRPYDPALVQKDVRKLASRGWFVNVEPTYERAANGRIVIFKVTERPIIRYVEYLGNDGIRTKKLSKETDLKVGGPIDPYAVEEARRKIIELYKRNGYNDVQVTILKGTKPDDQGIVFVINEGQMQKVWKVVFEGNNFASDGQLRTKVETKKPFMYLFKGFVDREMIEGDNDRIIAYYRSFGFFQAKCGAIPEVDEDGKWMTLRFVIHEGPRYDVESVAFIGNKLFASQSLAMGIVMPGGKPFEQAKMNDDVAWLKELYGSQGYVFADIEAEPIFLEEPGKLKLLYKIEEGKKWRIGNVFVHINGDNPHTKIQTALNRLSIRSGEIADIREIRASERRLQHSGLFLADPARGIMPKITYHIPELDETEMAEKEDSGFRGQSPDNVLPPSQGGLLAQLQGSSTAQLATPAGPPLIAPPGYNAAANSQAATITARHTYKVPTPSGIVRTGREVDVHVYLESLSERATAVNVDPNPSPSAQRHEVRRYPYDEPQPPASPYRQLTVRTQSPYQPPSTAYQQPAAGSTTSNAYGGQAVGATGPGGTPAASTYPVRQAAITEPQLPPTAPSSPVITSPQPAPAFGPPPMLPPPQQQYVPQYPPGGQPQYAPAPQYGPPPPAYTAPPALNPDPNITPIPIPSNPQQMPYPQNELTPMFQDPAVDLDVVLSEAQTGRLMLGVAVNSDAGLVGQILLDEQNFDWTRWPTSWDDFLSGKAWRGAGQRFRIEAAPGTEVHRYLVSFQEPYFMDTPVSLGLSGSFFDRRYDDWDEQRLGGRVSLGYQWTEDDVSAAIAYRGESVKISNPATAPGVVPALDEVVGENALHGFKFTLANDTRDSAFLATQGHFLQLELEQVIGSFEYPRAIFEGRKYFLVNERPDHTGRHVVTASTRLGFTGDDTPLYDRFFAGGFSTLRGFEFRGANPVEDGVEVGGDFMWVNTLEYLFPITADDMIHGVTFVDFGTVEEQVEIQDFRIAPGFGLRITIPAMGPAPIALDFAFPVAEAPTDEEQVFSFNIGLQR